MSYNKWITDRKPMAKDCVGAERMPDSNLVWVMYEGIVVTCPYADVVLGCPWQPIVVQKPEPYVEPKRWDVREYFGLYYIVLSCDYDTIKGFGLPTREAAERIAAIYEEVMP